MCPSLTQAGLAMAEAVAGIKNPQENNFFARKPCFFARCEFLYN